jgi:hypothetical protein
MYYLASVVGTGRPGDPYRAPEAEDIPDVPILDLRPDVTQPDGYVIAHYPERPSPVARRRLIPIGDGPARNLKLPDVIAYQFSGVELGSSFSWFAGFQMWTRGLDPNPKTMHWEIWLGGQLLWSLPKICGASQQRADESFDTTDGTTLGPDLSWTEIAQDWAIASNSATAAGPGSLSLARANYDLRTQNHYAQASLSVLSGASDRSAGVITRFDPASTSLATFTGYLLEINELNNRFALTRFVNGSGTGISGFVSLGTWPGLPNTARLYSLGSTHQVYFPLATHRASYTDTNITGYKRTGMSLYNSNSICRIASFRAGCFSPDHTMM